MTSSCSLLSFTSRTLEYFFLPVNVFGELPFAGCVQKEFPHEFSFLVLRACMVE